MNERDGQAVRYVHAVRYGRNVRNGRLHPLTDGLIALALYGGVAFLALYLPIFNAATHVGGTLPTDYYHFHWNYAWMRQAIGQGWTVYETNFVLFPYTTNLAYHTLTAFWYPVWALLEPLIGTFRAMNAIHWLALALNGWTLYLCARRFGIGRGWALAGGAVYLLTPATLLAAFITNPNYVSIFWYPLLLLTWREISARRQSIAGDRMYAGGVEIGLAVAFGIGLYGMMMTDLQHGLFSAFVLGPFIVYTLIAAPSWRARVRLIAYGVLAGGVFLGLFGLAGPLRWLLAFDRGELSPMALSAAGGIPFPDGYLWRTSPYNRLITLGSLVLPALIGGGLAALILVRMRQIRPVLPVLAGGLAALVLSTGPVIVIDGSEIATPYVLFHQAFGGLFRSPARFAPVIVLAAVIVGGAALPLLINRLGRGRVAVPRLVSVAGGAGLVFIALADGRIFEPMPLMPVAPAYDFYRQIGAETESRDHVVVNVPVAGGTGEAWVGEFPPMETQLYGMTHGRRMLNGSIARAPLRYFWYWLYDDPLLAWLGQRRYLEPAARDDLAQRIAEWPVGYIVLHQRYTPAELPTNIEWIGALNAWHDLLCVAWIEADAVVWRTSTHPAFADCPPRTPPLIDGAYVLDVGAADDVRYLGWGWHYREAISGIEVRWLGAHHPAADPLPADPPAGRLFVQLPPATYTLTVHMQAYAEPRTVQIAIDGTPVGDPFIVTTDALAAYTVPLPADLIAADRPVEIAISADAGLRPADQSGAGDARRLALLVDRVVLTPLP